jgi:hypothetical protein
MPHYRCAGCKTRLHVSGTPAELVGDLCPECGSLLEPVADPAELIGYRWIKTPESAADSGRACSHQQTAALVDEFVTRRAAILERDRLEAERWLDDSEDLRAEAITLLPPQTYR